MKLLIVIPSIGNPNLEEKLKFLNHNINIIKKNIKPDNSNNIIDLYLFNYSDSDINLEIENININIKKEKGILGEFIYKYIKPDLVSKYDYVFFIFDDITLPNNFDLNIMIKNYNKYNFDLLSPILDIKSKYSHKFMLENVRYKNKILITDFVEFFCYLMKPISYNKFFTLLNEESKWLWGVDYMYYKMAKMKCGIINDYKIIHHYKQKSYNSNLPCPRVELKENLNKINNDSTQNILNIVEFDNPIKENYINKNINKKIKIKILK